MDFIADAGEEIIPLREERMAKLRAIASMLEPLRAALDAMKCETALLISPRFNVAWTAACIDAMDWPDIELPLKYRIGFEVIFVLASIFQSFVFATSLFPAPARPLLTRAAAAERMAGALSGTAPHRSVEDMVGFATRMLSGATWRSGRPR